jgi:hypothetical protein
VLLSAASKPAIDQVPIRANTNEGGMFPEVLWELEANDAAMLEIYSLDAGFCSPANAQVIAEAHRSYISGLKGNQPELCRAAERVPGAQDHTGRAQRLGALSRRSAPLSSLSHDSDGSLSGLEPSATGVESGERDSPREDRPGGTSEP